MDRRKRRVQAHRDEREECGREQIGADNAERVVEEEQDEEDALSQECTDRLQDEHGDG